MSDDTTYQQLTLLLEDFHASLIPLPGSAEAQTMTVTSGRKCAALLPNSGPVGSLLKMCLGSEQLSSIRCFLTWKIRTTPAGRLIFLLSPSMPGTDVNASSLLLTLSTEDYKSDGPKTMQAWQEAEAQGKRPRSSAQRLRNQIMYSMWPTLTEAAADGGQTSRSGERKNELPLGGMARMMPTLKSRDYRSGSHLDIDRMQKKSNGTWHSPDLNDVIAPGGSLNPTWLEWFMGFPIGWTELED